MKTTAVSLLLLLSLSVAAQQRAAAKTVVDTLASPHFWGRGYTNNGMKKAADFLAAQFAAYGLRPMAGKSFLQSFSHPVNTFPGAMRVAVNGKDLVPGKDFLVSPDSRGVRAKGRLEAIDSVQFMNSQSRVIVKLEDKLTWSVATEAGDYTLIQVDRRSVDGRPLDFKADIENKWVENFTAANVCGMVKGTAQPDSVILITAHYDHLGGMGAATYFPGANDNASGVSLLLNLAKHYAEAAPRYTIGFVLFAGEEAGLIGSKHFTENPLVPLTNIRFLLNTDLAGTGEEGITVVNATEFPKEFEMLKAVNAQANLLTAVNARGKAANSDHYFFSEKGVPAFFFYTLGCIKAYHDVFDRAETLPLNEHEDLLKLVIGFNKKLMGE